MGSDRAGGALGSEEPTNPAIPLTPEKKQARVDAVVADAKAKSLPGPDAAHCVDFLYDELELSDQARRLHDINTCRTTLF